MKNIFYLLLFFPFISFAQSSVHLCLQKSNGRLQLRLIPDATFQGLLSDVQITIECDNNMVNLGTIMQPSPENQYIPMEKAGNDTIVNGKKYQTFVGTGLINMNATGINKTWQANTPYTIMELIPSSINANFSIVNNTYTTAFNRNAYVELNGNSRTGMITCSTNPLPNPLQLSAEWKAEDAFLQWIDASHSNTNYYVIERANEREKYQSIDTVLSSQLFYYDNKSKLANVSQYMYRIKALSYNGEESFSNEKTLWLENGFQVFSYPNPVENSLHLQVSDNSSTSLKVMIFTSEGKQIFEKEFLNFDIDISTENWASGVYLLKVVTDNQHSQKTIFIKS